MTQELRDVGEEIGRHLTEIAALFKPGRRLALVSWSPGLPERDMVMLEPGMTYQDVIDVLQRRAADPTTRTHEVKI